MRFSEKMLRLYAVTDRAWTGERSLFEQVESALKGGATLVQLREKDLDDAAFLEEAIQLTGLCHRYSVPLIVNDRVDIALKSGADGVHVGQEDMAAGDVRGLIGRDMILGVTAKTVEQAEAAQAAGADYLGSGAVFGSATKANALPMTRERLREICLSVDIPVVAIGGINRDNLPRLDGCGIHGVAVVSGIFSAADIEGECRLLRQMIDPMVEG